jgi:hypothetical protein
VTQPVRGQRERQWKEYQNLLVANPQLQEQLNQANVWSKNREDRVARLESDIGVLVNQKGALEEQLARDNRTIKALKLERAATEKTFDTTMARNNKQNAVLEQEIDRLTAIGKASEEEIERLGRTIKGLQQQIQLAQKLIGQSNDAAAQSAHDHQTELEKMGWEHREQLDRAKARSENELNVALAKVEEQDRRIKRLEYGYESMADVVGTQQQDLEEWWLCHEGLKEELVAAQAGEQAQRDALEDWKCALRTFNQPAFQFLSPLDTNAAVAAGAAPGATPQQLLVVARPLLAAAQPAQPSPVATSIANPSSTPIANPPAAPLVNASSMAAPQQTPTPVATATTTTTAASPISSSSAATSSSAAINTPPSQMRISSILNDSPQPPRSRGPPPPLHHHHHPAPAFPAPVPSSYSNGAPGKRSLEHAALPATAAKRGRMVEVVSLHDDGDDSRLSYSVSQVATREVGASEERQEPNQSRVVAGGSGGARAAGSCWPVWAKSEGGNDRVHATVAMLECSPDWSTPRAGLLVEALVAMWRENAGATIGELPAAHARVVPPAIEGLADRSYGGVGLWNLQLPRFVAYSRPMPLPRVLRSDVTVLTGTLSDACFVWEVESRLLLEMLEEVHLWQWQQAQRGTKHAVWWGHATSRSLKCVRLVLVNGQTKGWDGVTACQRCMKARRLCMACLPAVPGATHPVTHPVVPVVLPLPALLRVGKSH